jgi:hypothetical protein
VGGGPGEEVVAGRGVGDRCVELEGDAIEQSGDEPGQAVVVGIVGEVLECPEVAVELGPDDGDDGVPGDSGVPGGGTIAVPIWYDFTPERGVWVITSRTSPKGRAIDATGRYALVVQEEQIPYRYVSVEGPSPRSGPSTPRPICFPWRSATWDTTSARGTPRGGRRPKRAPTSSTRCVPSAGPPPT